MLSGMVRETTGMAKMLRMKMDLFFVLRREHMRYEPFDSPLGELQIGSMGTRSAQKDSISGLNCTRRITLATSSKLKAFENLLDSLPQRLHYRTMAHPDNRSIRNFQYRHVAHVT